MRIYNECMTKDELINYRQQLNLTQTEMSVILHLRLRQYQNYEWGSSDIKPALAELLLYKIKYGFDSLLI
jgi:DNA-binding transcriptional regulator YiaG